MPVAEAGSALLLDAAGTLLHPAESVFDTYARFATRFGVLTSSHQVARLLPEIMQRARPLRDRSPDWRPYWGEVVRVSTGCAEPAMLDALLEFYKRPEAWRVAEGAEACARAVTAAGMKVAIVSNWDTRLRPLLADLGVFDWIDAAVISAEAGVEKPDAGIFWWACDRVGVAPERALHVGDDPHDDVRGAQAAGCSALLWPHEVGSFAALGRRLLSPAELAG